ncbi:MAG: Cas8a1 family CRISPR/Cas system-associated protein [bacterium]
MGIFRWTGNPFVDTGLIVILHLTNKNDISELSYDDVVRVFNDGKDLARMNAKLKTFTMVFGRNGPLTNGYGYKQGTPSEKNYQIYISLVKGLLNASQAEDGGGYICEICGRNTNFDFANLYEQVLSKAGEKTKEGKVLGRDWFPLSGSLGSDAQALPSASRAMHICPACLFSVHYLPVALILFGGKVAVFQSTSQSLTIDLVTAIVDDTIARLRAGNGEAIGKKEGTKVLTSRLLNLIEKLQKERKRENLPDYSNLLVWKFSNSGTGADCKLEEIPNKALMFLWEVVHFGLRQEIDKLLANEPKYPRFQLLTAIKEGKDYGNKKFGGLYPFKKNQGVTPELFVLYQLKICRISKSALQIAQKIALKYINSLDDKAKKNVKSEIFRDNSNTNRVRRLMADMAESGELSYDDYTQLFVEISRHPIKVDWNGWDMIRFFLYHPEETEWKQKFNKIEEGGNQVKPHPLIKQASGLYFDDYVARRGLERFSRDILEGFKRGVLKRKWLEGVFLRLAEKGREEFNVENWDEFCCDEEGNPVLHELLFQMRLNLANLYGQKIKEEK